MLKLYIANLFYQENTMKNLGPKPMIYPMPVLILATYDKDGKPNAMNAA